MRDDFAGLDPKKIWQNQTIETPAITMKLIQRKARDLHARNRKQLLGTLAGPLAAAFFYVLAVREFPALQKLLHPLFAFALAWSFIGLYFLNRGMWSEAIPADAGLSAGLAFCRQEIERRRRLLRRVLLWSFGPILWAIGTFVFALAMVAGRTILPKGLPFLSLVILWILGYFVQRLREQRELKREIDDLYDIERENTC